MNQFKANLQASFEVKLYGTLESFIRWSITRTSAGIKVDQCAYIDRLLLRFGMDKCNPVTKPLGGNAQLRPRSSDEEPLNAKDHHLYRAIIGGLSYLATCTRPDISFTVSALARYLHDPSYYHLSHAKRVLRYVAGTKRYGLFFPARPMTSLSLDASVDSDWGADVETRRSTTGFVVTVNGAPVYWRSKRQTIVALSSGEAEYISLSSCARETSWLRKLFYEMNTQSPWNDNIKMPPTIINVDSSTAMSMACRESSTPKTKHVALKYHHIRDLVQFGVICINKVTTFEQIADGLTKVATEDILLRMVERLGLDFTV